MSTSSALDSFLGKWQQRWPEWSLVEPFIEAGQREKVVAWFALQQEFEDIYNASGDTTAVDAKLTWWGEELRSWASQRSRHPLGRVLEPARAPWASLAQALPGLLEAREALHDAAGARQSLQGYATAVAEVEAALFDLPPASGASQSVVTQVLAHRLDRLGQAAVPQDVPGEDSSSAIAAWAGQLMAGWPRRVPGPRPRRIHAVLARLRTQALASGKTLTPHPASVLLRAWWAGRGR